MLCYKSFSIAGKVIWKHKSIKILDTCSFVSNIRGGWRD